MKLSERMLYPVNVVVSFEIEPNSEIEKITHPNKWYEARVTEVAQLEAKMADISEIAHRGANGDKKYGGPSRTLRYIRDYAKATED